MDQKIYLTLMIFRTNQCSGKYDEYVKMKKKNSKNEYCFCASSKWFSPRKRRTWVITFFFFLTPAQFSCWSSYRAWCLLWDVKRRGAGGTKHFKIRSYGPLKKLVCSSKCRSHGLSESQQHSVRSQHVKACDWQFLFHERDVMERQREREQEHEREKWKQKQKSGKPWRQSRSVRAALSGVIWLETGMSVL